MKYLKLWENYNDFDIDALFSNIVDSEDGLIDDDNTEAKNVHMKHINTEGNDWKDATLRRIKTAKEEINSYIDARKSGETGELSRTYVIEALEMLAEMRYGAKEYSDKLKEVFHKAENFFTYKQGKNVY